MQTGKGCQILALGFLDPEIAPQAIVEKVSLFPPIKRGVKLGGQVFLHFQAHGLRQAMKFDNFIERRLVKRAADEPVVVPITVEIAHTQILDPDEAFLCIVKINSWGSNSVGIEKFCDLDVMPVFFALQIVFNKNQRLVRGTTNSIEFSIRSAFFDWANFYFCDIQARNMHPSSPEKKFSPHIRCSYCDGRR